MIYWSSVLREIFPALQPRTGLSEALEEKAKWLVNLRWLAIAAQLLCIVPGLVLGLLQPIRLPAYLAIVGFLIVFNLVISQLAKRLVFAGEWYLFGHLIIDLAALGTLLVISDGCQNPLVTLIYLNAALGPLILSGLRNVAFLAATCLCLVVVCYVTVTPFHQTPGVTLPREIKLGAELTVIALIWQLTRWGAGHLAQLNRSVGELEHRRGRVDNLRALGAMAASFSHEFATPLNTIKVRLERISRWTGANEKIERDATSAIAAIKQCESALRSLFAAEPSAKSAPIEVLVLKTFVESVCRTWHRDHADVSLTVSAVASARDAVCTVPGLVLARSLIDLLDNAVEAAQPGAATIHVSILADGAKAGIEIEDCGPGMAPEVKARLGEPFVTTRPAGAGLGLFTVHSLAEAFGGNLEIRDRVGGGTVVLLNLPVVRGAQ